MSNTNPDDPRRTVESPAEPVQADTVQPVLVIESAYVETPDSNPVIILGAISALVQSIITSGQVMPGIVAKHPTKPGYWLCLDGNKRLVACRVAGIKFRAVEHTGKVTPGALARTRIIANRSGKRMTDEQLANDLEAIQTEDGCTQAEAGLQCGVSASEASKAKGFIKFATQEVKEALANKQIVRDTARAISTVPQDRQKEFLEDVLRIGMCSDAAEKRAREMRQKRGPKQKKWSIKLANAAATIKGDLGQGAEALVGRLQEIIKRLKRGDGTDPLGGLVQ
jgi:ParB-like chromosome segregation protein Spo0J